MSEGASTSRAGFCAIIGRPNVGKSTYLNATLGQKLVAVTHKPQTTRDRIVGVKNLEGAQVVYVDTPGVHASPDSFHQYLAKEAEKAIGETDLTLLIVAVPRSGRWQTRADDEAVFRLLAQRRQPLIVGLNKVDRVKNKEVLLPLIEELGTLVNAAAIVPVCARSGEGIAQVEAEIARRLPEGPPLYPADALTDRAERFLAAELVREQVFLSLSEELPYATAVVVESFHDRGADIVIDADIVVEKDSQKGIVLGKEGQMIKRIGTRGRQAIAELLGRPVHLKLHVKVEKNWTRDPRARKRLGYE